MISLVTQETAVTSCASGIFFEENAYVMAIATGSAIKFFTFGGQDLIPLLTVSARERITTLRFLENGRQGPQSLVALTVFGDVYVFSWDDGAIVTDILFTNPEPRPILETYSLDCNGTQIVTACNTGTIRLWTIQADGSHAYFELATDNNICEVCLPCQNEPVVFENVNNTTKWIRWSLTLEVAEVLAYGSFEGQLHGTLAIPHPTFPMCLFTTRGIVFHTLDTRHLSRHVAQQNPLTMGVISKNTEYYTRVFGSTEDGDLIFVDLHKNNDGHSTTSLFRGTRPSSLTYIQFRRGNEEEEGENGRERSREYIFIGSNCNDSHLYLVENDMIYNEVATLENIGPIRDIIERRTRTVPEVVTSSGSGTESTLRFVSSQLKLETERFVPTAPATRCFAAKTPISRNHSILICSTDDGTRIFRVSERAELDEIQQHEFDLNYTLAASNLCDSQTICQITNTVLRILQFNMESGTWTVILNQNLHDLLGSVGHPFVEAVINPSNGTIVIAQQFSIHTMSVILEDGRVSIVNICRRGVTDEITCIALTDQSNSPGSERFCSKYFVMAIGGTSPSVFRLTFDLTDMVLIVLLRYQAYSMLVKGRFLLIADEIGRITDLNDYDYKTNYPTPSEKTPTGTSPLRLCRINSVYGFAMACAEGSVVIDTIFGQIRPRCLPFVINYATTLYLNPLEDRLALCTNDGIRISKLFRRHDTCVIEENIRKIGYCTGSDAIVLVSQRPVYQLESVPRALLNHQIRPNVIGTRYAELDPQPITTLTIVDARTRLPTEAQPILSSEKYIGMVTGLIGAMDVIAITTLDNVPEAPFKVRLWIGQATRLTPEDDPYMSRFTSTVIGQIFNGNPTCTMILHRNQVLIHLDGEVLAVRFNGNGIQFGDSVPHETPQPEIVPSMFVTCQDTTLHLSHFNFAGLFQQHLRQGLPQAPFFLSAKPTCFVEGHIPYLQSMLAADPILFGTETGSIGYILKFNPTWSAILREYERCIDTRLPRINVQGVEYVSQAVFDVFESAPGDTRLQIMTQLDTDGWEENTGMTLQQIIDSIRKMFMVLELE
ncbi:hypothetical protein B9Z55_026319 [Caenorhabditis nigoni]|nr:hypothetical protein B9Z55_026319 [Caenorhabditis nigoni]